MQTLTGSDPAVGLLQAAAEAANGRAAAFTSLVDSIRNDRTRAARVEVASPEALEDLERRFQTTFQNDTLLAVNTLGEVSARTLDVVVSVCDVLSCQFTVALLQERGVGAQLVDLSNIILTEANSSVD